MYPQFFDKFEDIINSIVVSKTILAPALLIFFEEAGFPLPGANFAIAFTGYQVSLGHVSYFLAFIILFLADLLGATVLYYLAFKYGESLILKIDKYMHLDKKKLKIVEEKFRKYGAVVIVFGRHIPGFRIPITIFSGISTMKYTTFLASTILSVIFWIPFYLSVGKKLGPKTIHLLSTNHWYYLLVLLTIMISIAPLFFLRKKRNS